MSAMYIGRFIWWILFIRNRVLKASRMRPSKIRKAIYALVMAVVLFTVLVCFLENKRSSNEHVEGLHIEIPFQKIGKHVVYTAYRDTTGSQNRLLVVGIQDTKLHHGVLFCNVTYERNNGLRWNQVVQASMKVLPGGNGYRYQAAFFYCPTVRDSIPLSVSLTKGGTSLLSNVVEVTSPVHLRVKRQFTVCLKPINMPYVDNINLNQFSLVEWFEFNRILGADHFVVYVYKTTRAIDDVLNSYRKNGLITVITFPLPVHLTGHISGDMVAINDCVRRTGNSTKYIVHIDANEFLIPKEESYDWPHLMTKYDRRERACEYRVRTAIVSRTHQDQALKYKGIKEVIRHQLNTQLEFWRFRHAFNDTDGMIYFSRPECISVAGKHHIWEYTRSEKFKDVVILDPVEVLGYKFSQKIFSEMSHSKMIYDNYLLKYKTRLLPNVIASFRTMANRKIT